jgi:hypothetical protein
MALSIRTRTEASEHYAVQTWPIAWQAFAGPARIGLLAR